MKKTFLLFTLILGLLAGAATIDAKTTKKKSSASSNSFETSLVNAIIKKKKDFGEIHFDLNDNKWANLEKLGFKLTDTKTEKYDRYYDDMTGEWVPAGSYKVFTYSKDGIDITGPEYGEVKVTFPNDVAKNRFITALKKFGLSGSGNVYIAPGEPFGAEVNGNTVTIQWLGE